MLKKFIQFVVIPFILIASDFFIGFTGHYSGTTGNDYSLEAFSEYLSHLTLESIAPTLAIALFIVILIEILIRKK